MYPVTDEGRGFCIFFALVGIPLFMACLAVYAQHTANFIRWVCKKLRKLCGGQENDNEKVSSFHHLEYFFLVLFNILQPIESLINSIFDLNIERHFLGLYRKNVN